MKALLIAVALAAPVLAFGEASAPARVERGFHASLYQRYCEKLRAGPEEYVQFVRRMYPVHGLTYSDFAPEKPGAPVRAECGVAPERVAAVQQALRKEAR